MKKLLDAVAGYVLAVFAAALVITIAITPFTGVTSGTAWSALLTDAGIFWISIAARIAVAAAIPALVGILIAHVTGLRNTLFYCLWSLMIALGMSLASNRELSIESLLTLAIAGIVAGLAYRAMNPPPQPS